MEEQTAPAPGQRWMSRSEPKLGLGVILEVEGNQVVVFFPAAEETRRYAMKSAPLVRVRYKEGDLIANQTGCELKVLEVRPGEGAQLSYLCEGGEEISEVELLDTLSFSSPEQRLLAGICDDFRLFDFRKHALRWNSRLKGSPARGFVGARVDLLPHQFAIVAEAASRVYPRLLLADEVGLGKTIEACLILHHLHLTGRANRVLVLVPESLVHQWFVELYKRFQLLFALFDESRVVSLEAEDPEGNPFLDSQLILASVDYFAEHPNRAQQAREADFDLLIVDEAHHLEWMPEDQGGASESYEMVEGLAQEIASVLLLTATPQQLGPEGHFARLRLLDPDRYTDLEAFVAEVESYEPLATAVEMLDEGKELPAKAPAVLAPYLESSSRARKHYDDLVAGDESVRAALIRELVDSFGTGRIIFRNTRERLEGFPKRQLNLSKLEKGQKASQWLADLLRSLGEEKILLITHTLESALRIQENLLDVIHVESALFHEELSLMERDRNAAWFADPEGARILICSEIGSEGRNFQFAHHLVLFDLPQNPEVLEQRIGRLDRIGQTKTIEIHVPYVAGTGYEMLTRWLAEGLEAFEKPLKGAATLQQEFLPELLEFVKGEKEGDFEEFLARTKKRRLEVAELLASGHDRLLVMGAPPVERAEELLGLIDDADNDVRFEDFAVRLFDQQGLDVEDLADRQYLLKRGQRLSETFADLPEDGMAVSFLREEALYREDLAMMTGDHPSFRSALDQFLVEENGNSTFAHCKAGKGKGIFFEANFVLETSAPARLHIERFLAPTLLSVAVDHKGTDRSGERLYEDAPLRPADPHRLVSQESFRKSIFPTLLEQIWGIAKKQAVEPREEAIKLAKEAYESSLARLKDLASRNPHVSPQEISKQEELLAESLAAIEAARLRLDSVRLVWQS